MADFLLRNLDERLLALLRERAEKNGRSLQAEIQRTLRDSTKMTREETLESSRRFREMTKGRTTTPSWVLIREDRDR